jgi:hypothetical protein
MKEKGRGFALCSELYAINYQPLPGPFHNRKEVYWQRYSFNRIGSQAFI